MIKLEKLFEDQDKSFNFNETKESSTNYIGNNSILYSSTLQNFDIRTTSKFSLSQNTYNTQPFLTYKIYTASTKPEESTVLNNTTSAMNSKNSTSKSKTKQVRQKSNL